MQKNLMKNDEIIVTIERLGSNGEGIASFNGKIIFVPFALTGEKVKVHIIKDKKNYYIAKVVEFYSQSPNRVSAPCPYFQKCGGCNIQHLNYSNQLELKKNIVKNSLEKFAKLSLNVNEVVASDKQYRYRNKLAFPVQFQDDKLKIGMFREFSHTIIEIDDCLLQSEKVKTILHSFKEYMIENNISAYNETTNLGDIKHIVLRENDNAFLLTVVVSNEDFNNFQPLINKFKKNFSEFGIIKNVNKLNNNVILGNKNIHIYGTQELKYNEFGITYYVNNQSFLQVNNYIKTEIYKKIIELVGDCELVIDAYSGTGLLSSILAKHSKQVIGIEIVKEATKNANELKKINNLTNLTNINGDCALVLPELAKKISCDFVVVIDPPRKGIDKIVLDALINSKPQKIIYLSCNPDTLARDLSILKQEYHIDYVQPYDMFPQTANIETLVCMTKL